jgi:uncharacterized sporulation protein YeaH/YhbH (DUF444 family)
VRASDSEQIGAGSRKAKVDEVIAQPGEGGAGDGRSRAKWESQQKRENENEFFHISN